MLGLLVVQQITISDFVLIALIVVSVVALLCIRRAHANLKQEAEVLQLDVAKRVRIRRIEELVSLVDDKRIRDDDGKIIRDPYDAIVRHAGLMECELNSAAAVQRYLFAGDATMEKVNLHHAGYVADRLYAILCSVSTSNLVRKSPPLEDLHELTIQKERGSASTSVFRMLIPSILVLGILGTLVGVHEKLLLIDKELGLVELADALLPGAIAVGATVVVMMYRGVYNKTLSRFVAAFNEYTITRLLPFFRPISQSQADINQLVSALTSVKSSYADMQNLWKSVCWYNRGVLANETGITRIINSLHENLESLREGMEYCHRLHERNLKWQDNAAECVVEMSEVYGKLRKSLRTCQKKVHLAEKVVAEMHERMALPALQSTEQWGAFQDILEKLKTLGAKLESCVRNDFNMPDVARDNKRISDMLAWQDNLSARVDEYRQIVEKIAVIDENIDRNVDVLRGYVDSLSGGDSSVLASVQKRYNVLVERSKPMRNAFYETADSHISTGLARMVSEMRSTCSRYGRFRKYHFNWNEIQLFVGDTLRKLRIRKDVRSWVVVALVTMILWSITLVLVWANL